MKLRPEYVGLVGQVATGCRCVISWGKKTPWTPHLCSYCGTVLLHISDVLTTFDYEKQITAILKQRNSKAVLAILKTISTETQH